jgi:uncharacterized membrane protein YqgA involved in biofilm formation
LGYSLQANAKHFKAAFTSIIAVFKEDSIILGDKMNKRVKDYLIIISSMVIGTIIGILILIGLLWIFSGPKY